MSGPGFSKHLEQLGAVAVNAAHLLMHGGFETGEQGSPFEVVTRSPVCRLRRYFPDADKTGRPAVVLVPPMMLLADIYDMSAASSAVGVLHEHGADPWVVDFGVPEQEEGGLERDLADHILAVSAAVDSVRESTGRDVHLGGYSQGGVFSYSVAAYRRGDGLASVLAFGSPVDTRSVDLFAVPAPILEFAASGATSLMGGTGLPAWAAREAFRLIDPVKTVRARVNFLRRLHDRDALLPNERQRRFVDSEGWIAWPAPALADTMRQFVAQNRLVTGGLVMDDRAITLADLDRPVLCFIGENDKIGQPESIRAIRQAAPRADTYECTLPVGHLGIVVGSAATASTWPTVAAWAAHVDHGTALPATVTPMANPPPRSGKPRTALQTTASYGLGAGRRAVQAGVATFDTARAVALGLTTSVPRLLRLELVGPQTRVSLGRLLDEHADRDPDAVRFLWEDRVHTHAALKARIDAVVAGLLSLGIRRGEPIGVLMDSRPSMVAAVAALNRIGAVAVLLRPDGDPAHEAALGGATRIVTDPEHLAFVREHTHAQVLVLGGGSRDGDTALADPETNDVVDLEAINPDAIGPPAWYRPNPGRARDLAFVLFAGDGPATTTRPITNARWARAALGTAASAGLGPRDTVFSVNPIHHPSGLLTSLGGAVASGARFAMASKFDPDRFWEETRRYGVTVVSYTWTMLRDIVEAPPHPGEQHHGIRTFIGSGMPTGLWHRVSERMSPAKVVEYYASTRTDAVLINTSGRKVGCKGLPLPGGPELVIARIDEATGRLALRADGSAQRCRPRQIGLLLARNESETSYPTSPLRGLFTPDDAWSSTGDLFYQDEDGDFWLAGTADTLVITPLGIVAGSAVQDVLGSVEPIDLSATYGILEPDGNATAVTAITLRAGHALDQDRLSEALGELPPDRRPHLVHVVDHIAVNAWHRPVTDALEARGLPVPGPGVFTFDPVTGGYRTHLGYQAS